MFQTLSNLKRGTYTLFSNQLDEKIEISCHAAALLRKAQKENDFSCFKADNDRQKFFTELIKMGFIIESKPNSYTERHVYLLTKCTEKFPLTSLNLELLNVCNLRCKHCYGSFPQSSEKKIIPLAWIQKSLYDFNKLHVQNISLTGGEATLHPNFHEIAQMLFENGFNLCIFTNGYNPDSINRLLTASKQYKFSIKISLDGFEEIHNWIRGKDDSFIKVIQSLDAISQYPNVTLYISTVILRKNMDTMNQFSEYVRKKYPNAIHTKDLAFPLGNACDKYVFSVNEYDQFADLLKNTEDIPNESLSRTMKYPFRCSGGVSQCTLMPTGFLKICNAACDPQFHFKYNAFDTGLLYAWKNCGTQIAKIRKEKPKQAKACRHCKIKRICAIENCRVLAWIYTGDARGNNPLACKMELERVRRISSEIDSEI